MSHCRRGACIQSEEPRQKSAAASLLSTKGAWGAELRGRCVTLVLFPVLPAPASAAVSVALFPGQTSSSAPPLLFAV